MQSVPRNRSAVGRAACFLLLGLLGIVLSACAGRPTGSPDARFDGATAYTWVTAQCDLGYRSPGTEANRQAGDMFLDELSSLGWNTSEQSFTYLDTPVRNILAWKGEGEAVLLGAHYDTRPSADQENPAMPVMGANDGASGVAVLLELARVLAVDASRHQVYLGFFDAEDSGHLNGWAWIVGSTYMAEHWGEAGEAPLTAMVLVDMIGDADLQVFYEGNSDSSLSATLWSIAKDLGYGDRIIPEIRHTMLDDHIPFAQKGIPAVDMIDFDYPYWHTMQDTPDKVSGESLEAIGRTLEVWLEGE